MSTIKTMLAVALLCTSTVFATTGCGSNEPERAPREGGDRDGGSDENAGGGGSGGGNDECYNDGWNDCVDYYDPDPSYWGCSGGDADDYWDGYCDCEYYYDDWYYC